MQKDIPCTTGPVPCQWRQKLPQAAVPNCQCMSCIRIPQCRIRAPPDMEWLPSSPGSTWRLQSREKVKSWYMAPPWGPSRPLFSPVILHQASLSGWRCWCSSWSPKSPQSHGGVCILCLHTEREPPCPVHRSQYWSLSRMSDCPLGNKNFIFIKIYIYKSGFEIGGSHCRNWTITNWVWIQIYWNCYWNKKSTSDCLWIRPDLTNILRNLISSLERRHGHAVVSVRSLKVRRWISLVRAQPWKLDPSRRLHNLFTTYF